MLEVSASPHQIDIVISCLCTPLLRTLTVLYSIARQNVLLKYSILLPDSEIAVHRNFDPAFPCGGFFFPPAFSCAAAWASPSPLDASSFHIWFTMLAFHLWHYLS